MMQVYAWATAQWPRERLREAADWALRLAAIIGPDEPTARAELLRLSGALIDAYEARVREEFGLPQRDLFADGGDAA